MEDYDKSIEDAKKQIAEAQLKLLDVHFNKIKEYYSSALLDDRIKLSIVGRLEKFVQDMQKIPANRQNLAFDSVIAIDVREKAGLKLADLTEKLFGNRRGSYYQMLMQYEHGARRPSNPPKGECPKKYIEWLKNQGYNPFGL